MKTPWTDSVDINAPLPEYPRPQMARRSWLNLNGQWLYAFTDSSRRPAEYDGEIIVPFSPETELSGVGRALRSGEYLWYCREVEIPAEFSGKRLLLHFGAVDQCAAVWVNSTQVARHTGGYLPFEADITDAVDDGYAQITVRVTDDTDRSFQSRGKQSSKRGGIWYTPQSGIWQTVWLEAVPETYVRSLRITPDIDKATVTVEADVRGDEQAYAHFDGQDYPLPAEIPVLEFEPWCPENPKLYGFSVSCGEDEVFSYFAMRKFSYVELGGHKVFGLNNVPLFHNGLLDQGYYPDGLLTPPSDEAMVHDIETMKRCGFNMLRKHIKIEPLRWYYHCDRLGMIVWQDMVSGGQPYSFLHVSALPTLGVVDLPDRDAKPYGRSGMLSRARFRREMADTVRHLYNCPCIALWTVFNEGWGQFDALEMANELKMLDATRFIDHASGWQDQGREEMKSRHIYFRPVKLKNDGRALALTEYGGYVLAVDGHRWTDRVFGYRICRDAAALTRDYEKLMLGQVLPHIRKEGLTAAVYTQITDVEEELNGLMSYDREVLKIPEETLREINAALHFDA